jgi:ribosomal protein S18 acetylase RimI-like enzyme
MGRGRDGRERSDLRVDRITEADAGAVRTLLVELALEEQERYDHPRQSRSQVEAGTHAPGPTFLGENHLYVARGRAGGEALGVCWVVLYDPGTGLEGEVAELYVAQRARGRGVATALLDEAMALFRLRRVTFASVWTRGDNPAALAAYRAAGFTTTEQTVLTWLPLEGRGTKNRPRSPEEPVNRPVDR